MYHTRAHDHRLPEPDSSDEAGPEDHRKHTPAPRRALGEGASWWEPESSPFCTPESPTLLFTCPSLHKTTPSHEDLPPPSLIFFISRLNGHRPRPYLSREAEPGLLHISFMLGCHFAHPLFHQGPAPCSLTYLCHCHGSRNTAAILSASGCFFGGGELLRGDCKSGQGGGSTYLIVSLR